MKIFKLHDKTLKKDFFPITPITLNKPWTDFQEKLFGSAHIFSFQQSLLIL